ncbi:hypothetical protein Fot_14470 [Forsythia ovata]|uniref:Uncharacterized protein n=1 Tax=Forsythia ovata TaxID=205694 RepID=A0ABD1W6Q4_9LAMI
MAAAAIQRKDLEKLMQLLNILTEMLIDQRSRRQHGIILSSIIICEPLLSELMSSPGAGRTRSLMEKTASFGSRISELSPGNEGEDCIVCINRQHFLDGND